MTLPTLSGFFQSHVLEDTESPPGGNLLAVSWRGPKPLDHLRAEATSALLDAFEARGDTRALINGRVDDRRLFPTSLEGSDWMNANRWASEDVWRDKVLSFLDDLIRPVFIMLGPESQGRRALNGRLTELVTTTRAEILAETGRDILTHEMLTVRGAPRRLGGIAVSERGVWRTHGTAIPRLPGGPYPFVRLDRYSHMYLAYAGATYLRYVN